MFIFLLSLLLALTPASVREITAVTLILKANGLNTPTRENGRTEYELADVNGDGHLDIISLSDHGNPGGGQLGIMVWFGDGLGNWSVAKEGNFGYGGCAMGDLNNDGIMDIAWGIHHDYGSGGFGDRLMGAALGNGTGNGWVPWGDGLAENGEDWGMFATDLADFDNDGLLDIVSQSFGSGNGVRVYRNHGDGTWTQEWAQSGSNANYTLETGDFDADGNMDFICTRQGTYIFFGDGAFGFTLDQSGFPPNYLLAVDTGDFNNDGADDILVSMGSDSGVRAYSYDTGTQQWVDMSIGLPSGVSHSMVQFGDLNGDGFLDVVTYAGTMGRTYMGNGQGNWVSDATFSFSTPGHYSAMRVSGDFDHDGREDIVVQAAEGTIWTYTNIARAYSPWQEPSVLTTRLVTPRGGETFMAGSARFVNWLTAVPPAYGQASIDLHFSSTGPDGPWTPMASGLPDNCRFQWTVPQVNSTECRVRITATAGGQTHQYLSPGDFSVLQGVGVGEGVSAPLSVEMLKVFPNPSAGTPSVLVGQGLAGELRVYDIAGRQVIGMTVDGGSAHQLLTEGERPLPAGVYVAVLNTPSRTLSTVFVKIGD
jgi:hypothetical protein